MKNLLSIFNNSINYEEKSTEYEFFDLVFEEIISGESKTIFFKKFREDYFICFTPWKAKSCGGYLHQNLTLDEYIEYYNYNFDSEPFSIKGNIGLLGNVCMF